MQKILNKFFEYIYSFRLKIDSSSLSKRLFDGISWTLIGNIAGKFSQLIAFIIVARIVGKSEYGQISIIRSTLNMFLIFSTAGMGITTTRYLALYRDNEPDKALAIYLFTKKTAFWIGLLISFFILIFSKYIADYHLHNINLSTALKIGAITLFLMTINSVQNGALNGFEKFKKIGINNALNGLVQLIFIVVGAFLGGVNGVITAICLSVIIFIIQFEFALKPEIALIGNTKNSKTKENLRLKSIFLKFSLPAVLQGLVFIPVLWWAKTFLIENRGYEELASYDVAEQWYYVVLFIPNALSTIILPLLTNTSLDGTKNQYNKLIKINLLINIGVSFIIATMVGILAPHIYKFYGKDYTNFTPLVIMLLTVVICAANNVFGQVITSKGKMWIGFGVNAIWAVWLIFFSILFIGKMQMGATGLAYALLLSYSLHSVLQGFLAFILKFK